MEKKHIRDLHKIHPVHCKLMLDKLVLPYLQKFQDAWVIHAHVAFNMIIVVVVGMTFYRGSSSVL